MTHTVFVDSVLYAKDQVVDFPPPRDVDVVAAGYGEPADDASVFVEHGNRLATEGGAEAPPTPVAGETPPKVGFWKWLLGGG